MEFRDPKYFRHLLVERKDPAGNPRGFGNGWTRDADAGGPDESPRVPMKPPFTCEEIFFFEAEP